MDMKIFVALTFASFVQSFVLDNSCDISAVLDYGNDANTGRLNVPIECRNGIFRWDYPRGHVMLHFSKRARQPIRICFRDDLGGHIFTISDVTPEVNSTFERFKQGSDNAVCTDWKTATDVVIKVDAPIKDFYYMGSVKYTVEVQKS